MRIGNFVQPDFAERAYHAAQVAFQIPQKRSSKFCSIRNERGYFREGIHFGPQSWIQGVQLGERVSIGPLAVIEAGTRIGDGQQSLGAGS